MRLTLVEPPASFIELNEARQHCRADPDEELDAVVERSVNAAISFLDGYRGILRRCIVNQEWRLDVAAPLRTVRLPFPDISGVAVRFADGDEAMVPFEICHDGLALNFGMRIGRPITITFTAGFGTVDDVPPAIKTAALMLTNFFYRQRGGQDDGPGFPPEVDVLVAPYKVWRV